MKTIGLKRESFELPRKEFGNSLSAIALEELETWGCTNIRELENTSGISYGEISLLIKSLILNDSRDLAVVSSLPTKEKKEKREKPVLTAIRSDLDHSEEKILGVFDISPGMDKVISTIRKKKKGGAVSPYTPFTYVVSLKDISIDSPHVSIYNPFDNSVSLDAISMDCYSHSEDEDTESSLIPYSGSFLELVEDARLEGPTSKSYPTGGNNTMNDLFDVDSDSRIRYSFTVKRVKQQGSYKVYNSWIDDKGLFWLETFNGVEPQWLFWNRLLPVLQLSYLDTAMKIIKQSNLSLDSIAQQVQKNEKKDKADDMMDNFTSMTPISASRIL